jgi:hypothetical protein
MSFELTGKLIVVNPTQQITETFSKREFVQHNKLQKHLVSVNL